METLPRLPRITEIITREVEPGVSFELAAARFSAVRGTVALLSGSDVDCARFHCLAVDPWLELTGRGRQMQLTVRDAPGESTPHVLSANPFDLLNRIMDRLTLSAFQTHLPCAAGLFGYFAYDLKDQIECLPCTCTDTFLPDLCLYAPSVILTQDLLSCKTWLTLPVLDGDRGLADACADRFLSRLAEPWSPLPFSIDSRGFVSSYTRSEYMAAVSRVIDHLSAGDIYQANLSQRFETVFSGDTYSLFLELFKRNPAAFFSYINAGDHQVVSTSPERFIQVDGRQVETRPIKGTIARGRDPESDRLKGQWLCDSLKDDAELTMIVDLMRNDISRVTEHGSVQVTEHKRLEPYENVFHLVSVVKGQLEPDKTMVDLVRATFPGGSITGCPKIRSMQIIDAVEPVRRHVYTGSIGYLSFHHTMDLSIAIRTATVFDGCLVFSVGGGIVIDSDPKAEFQETLDKGKTIMETLSSAAGITDIPRSIAWENGKMIDQDKTRAPAAGQGFQYGAGLFETIRVDNGQPVRLDRHMQRMKTSWSALFDSGFPEVTWDAVICQLLAENHLEDKVCAVKILVAKDGRPGHRVYAAAFVRPYVHRLEVLGKAGLDLGVYPMPRSGCLADHKTMNYLYYERAGDWARKQGKDEALILNPDSSVSETNTCSVFAVYQNTLVVPISDHVLASVTLAALKQAAINKGFSVRQEHLTVEQLEGLPNVMAANALMGVVPVNRINDTDICHEPGVCEKMNRLLDSLG